MPNIIRFGGYSESVPSIFGTGADGDAVISGTVTLPVAVPHQSIVEKQYKSLIINAGAILKCASWNAGLILRVKGDCTIHGTIDQSGMAPKTNPQNNYPYPAQLVCGNGGNGAAGANNTTSGYGGGRSGNGMLKRPYGGGYGGGAGGGAGSNTNGNYGASGGDGGDSTDITIDIESIFIGGEGGDSSSSDPHPSGYPGQHGGGGGGGYGGGDGGTSPGENGVTNGGGAGNYGGGVILLYVGGNLLIDGSLLCNGLKGGDGGNSNISRTPSGSGGGGGGGGAIYILHKGTYTNSGLLQVNGGAGGNAGTTTYSMVGSNGSAGGIGSITVIQGDK